MLCLHEDQETVVDINTELALQHGKECSSILEHSCVNKEPTLCSKSAASQKSPHKAWNEPPQTLLSALFPISQAKTKNPGRQAATEEGEEM